MNGASVAVTMTHGIEKTGRVNTRCDARSGLGLTRAAMSSSRSLEALGELDAVGDGDRAELEPEALPE